MNKAVPAVVYNKQANLNHRCIEIFDEPWLIRFSTALYSATCPVFGFPRSTALASLKISSGLIIALKRLFGNGSDAHHRLDLLVRASAGRYESLCLFFSNYSLY